MSLPDLIAYGAAGSRLAVLAATGAELRRAERRSSVMAGVAAAVTALATGLCVLVGLAAGAIAVRAGPARRAARGRGADPLAVFETAAGLPVAAQRFVAALLVRFLDPSAGRVTLDGVDLRKLSPEGVRQIVGYLPENAHLFDTTIAANLRVAGPAATDAELRSALSQARLLDWVDTLPDGLDTLVGEHGTALSGGQRRRLALARAVLAGFQVLILDEPTEHLDDETATALTHDLLSAAGDRTVLLITHRTDVTGAVDRVLHLDRGGVERPGTPVPGPGLPEVRGRVLADRAQWA